MFSEVIGFSDIESRFNSLKKKHKLNKLTEGVYKLARHAEAHVDYIIDYDNEIITFNNKKRKITEEMSYEEFWEQFDYLYETISSIIASFEIFLMNNDDYTDLSKSIHEILEKDVSISQVDIAPTLKGIVVNNKHEIEQDDLLKLTIDGTYTGDYSEKTPEDLITIFYTIAKFEPQYDYIALKLYNTEGKELLLTKYLNITDKLERC